jgi:hypothetical protein
VSILVIFALIHSFCVPTYLVTLPTLLRNQVGSYHLHIDCTGACQHDPSNEHINDLLDSQLPPKLGSVFWSRRPRPPRTVRFQPDLRHVLILAQIPSQITPLTCIRQVMGVSIGPNSPARFHPFRDDGGIYAAASRFLGL